MWWIALTVVQCIVFWSGVRQEQRAGTWSWSKFVFALAFGLLECVIIMVPLTYIDPHSRYFKPIVAAAVVIAVLNFIYMVIVARRWRLPDGRTSLQTYYDSRNGEEKL